jgi:hypothetical protein
MLASKRAEVGSILLAITFDACENERTGVSLRSGMSKRERGAD